MTPLGPQSRPALYSVDGGKGGAGGPPSDMLNERVAVLEHKVDAIGQTLSGVATDLAGVRANDLPGIRERLATIEERMAHLPGKGFIVTALMAMLAAIAGLIAFADQIRALIAGG